jgi:hypothetical protein
MKKINIVLLLTILATAVGLYLRPSYPVIGQLNWWNVLTKGYFIGTFSGLFSQGFIDESFWYVMRFTGGGFAAGIVIAMLMGKGGSKSSGKKKK